MKKLNRDEIKTLVSKIRMGEGDDHEVSMWVQNISMSVPHPEVIKVIMSGAGVTDEEVVEKLYNYKPIIL